MTTSTLREMWRLTSRCTAIVLAAVAGLHLLWARGSSFPFSNRDDLAQSVVGSNNVPSAAACVAVSGALLSAAVLVAGTPPLPPMLRRLGVVGVTTTLATRGALGLAGRTDLVSPGSLSARFRRLDRRVFSPLCLALAAGSATALAQ
jgi:hypothetical protein